MSLRTLMLAVLIFGAALGWRNFQRRRASVAGLVAVVRSGILLEVGPSQPLKDPTSESDRGRYRAALHRVRSLHAEPLAVPALVETLRVARSQRDENSMRGALALLMWLGSDARGAVSEVIRTARGEQFRSGGDQGTSQIRNLAIHVLGVHAIEDEFALAALVATMEGLDSSFQRTISSSAANELGGLGPRAKVAVPALVKALEPRHRLGPPDLLRVSALSALGRIGPGAVAAIPKLVEIANDAQDGDRLEAIKALGEIALSLDSRRRLGGPRSGTGPEPAPSFIRIIEVFESLSDNGDSVIQEELRWQLRRLGTLERSRFQTAR